MTLLNYYEKMVLEYGYTCYTQMVKGLLYKEALIPSYIANGTWS